MKSGSFPTIADIAREAGTNRSTVSRVLNNKPDFSAGDECRRRILEIAKKLNYQPRFSARSLATNRSYCVGVVLGKLVQDLASPFFAPVLMEMSRVLNENGYYVQLIPVYHEDSFDEDVRKVLLGGGVDGFYVGSSMIGEQTLCELSQRRVPVVTTERMNRAVQESDAVSVVMEDFESAYREMVRELYSAGHRKVVSVYNDSYGSTLTARMECFERQFGDFGGGGDPVDRLSFCPRISGVLSDRHEARIWASSQMDRLRNYTAVVCASDLTALGVCDAFREAGIEPGRDIAVLGYDNLEGSPFFASTEPFLTTVDPGKAEKGRMIAEILLERMGRPELSAVKYQVHAKFISRCSMNVLSECSARDK